MLVEFANSLPGKPAFLRFQRKWERVSPLKWHGGHEGFLWSQRLVREIWEGKEKGIEGFQVALSLGIKAPSDFAEEGEQMPAPPIAVDWEAGRLILDPRNLNDMVWLTLLQHSRRLGICASRDSGCPAPYFLKYRPQQEFCSQVCALPRQREFKRRWWADKGNEWQRKRREKQGANRANQFWEKVENNHRKERKAKEGKR